MKYNTIEIRFNKARNKYYVVNLELANDRLISDGQLMP